MRRRGCLTYKEVLRLIKQRLIRVDTDKGVVYGVSGLPLKAWPYGDPVSYLAVKVCYQNKQKTIGLARLVWMAKTKVLIPFGFEIHHDDGDVNNNRWDNLYCFYHEDHKKLHNRTNGDVPF